MNKINLIAIVIFLVAIAISCDSSDENKNKFSSEQVDSIMKPQDETTQIYLPYIKKELKKLAQNDKDVSFRSDDYIQNHYTSKNINLIWLDKIYLLNNKDSLLSYFKNIEKTGLSSKSFYVNKITETLNLLLNSLPSKENYNINEKLAELEYKLSKAYLRYVSGQYYGFTRPDIILNKLDVQDNDTTNTKYKHLFDVKITHANNSFYNQSLRNIKDSMLVFLQNIQPKGKLYSLLINELQQKNISNNYKNKLIVNIERCRWKDNVSVMNQKKYIIVNIPSFMLYAVDDTKIKIIKTACGALTSKTPLLNSYINRIDINPLWIIPQKIINKDIAQHAGNEEYFEARRYYVCKRPSLKKVDLNTVTEEMLRSGKYSVIQERGEGNSLGRIIFRFNNNFAVYLHDTPSQYVFDNSQRAVSHGCVRVQNPYNLAEFIIGIDKEDVLEKVRYSMETNLSSSNEENFENKIDYNKIIHSVKVEPQIPVSLAYYTVFYDENNNIHSYNDIYGYDCALYDAIKYML